VEATQEERHMVPSPGDNSLVTMNSRFWEETWAPRRKNTSQGPSLQSELVWTKQNHTDELLWHDFLYNWRVYGSKYLDSLW